MSLAWKFCSGNLVGANVGSLVGAFIFNFLAFLVPMLDASLVT